MTTPLLPSPEPSTSQALPPPPPSSNVALGDEIAPPPGLGEPDWPTRPTRERNAGHIVAIVVGCLLLLPMFGLAAGGGALALGQATATDDDGYFRFTLDRVESAGVAVAGIDLWLGDFDDETPWVFDWLDVDLRLRVEGVDAANEVFVGIARTRDVERYLDGAEWSEVVEFDGRAPRYEQVTGSRTIESPLAQDFWTETVAGSGEQELNWNARGGRWSVVIMNADGSPIVDADVEVGLRSGAVTPVAVTMLVVGATGLAIAIALIVVGSRGRRGDTTPAPTVGTGV